MDRQDEHTVFTEEALKAQDGKKVPLTSEPGGPVIGEATMRYDAETKSLQADLQVNDEKLADLIKPNLDSFVVKKES